ncbi:MAG: cation:dicarboxylase symporter family transporter [Treponema sp.]|jgi:Na+/H+-dicarboxylate symporter|nr:cation:dicarboxylase symporter family transporter [Treponema sp.]
MKVWVKLLVGSILGITLGFLIPENQRLAEVLVWLEQFVLRIGRYAVIPMLVFSLTIGIYDLRQDRQFWPLVLKNLLMIAGVSILIIFSGVLATLVFLPSRIPILAEEQIEVIRLDVAGYIKDLFPYNMFSVLAGDGVYLFPVCIFAFFFGIGLSYGRSYGKPVIILVDSLSHIFDSIGSLIMELLGFIMIVLSCYWAIRFQEILRTDIFLDLILLLGVFAVGLSFGIFPLLLYFLRPKTNPWAVLYGSLGPAIAAFFSGDINFSLPVLLTHTKDNFGIQRRSNAVSLALFSSFCRAGSAMVATIAFIVVFKSYSSLGITFAEVLSISVRALIISCVLVRHPGDGAYTALAVLCLGYGKGFEAGYLILKPLAFYLVAVGTYLDVMIASFAAYTVARISGLAEEKNVAHFI